MTHCELCYEEPVERRCGDRDLCAECARWDDYWSMLTPAERRAEFTAMDAYVDEHRGDR